MGKKSEHGDKRKPAAGAGGGTFCVSRGVALFLGAFALLNVVASLAGRAAGQEIWWLDFSSAERLLGSWGHPAVLLVEAAAGLLFVVWAVCPACATWRRVLTAVAAALLAVVAFSDALAFWNGLAAGRMSSGFPVPLSCLLGVAFFVLCTRVWSCAAGEVRQGSRLGAFGLVAAFAVCAALFPLAQVATFGMTDYRSSADAVLVPGAQLQPSGTLPPVLKERLDTAAGLCSDGRVACLVASGGTDSSGANEAAAMAAYARERGVPADSVVEDRTGTSTGVAVDDTLALAQKRGWDAIAVASSFYQMPRLKMLFLARGADAATVPVVGDVASNGTLPAVFYEIPAWWGSWFACYLL